MSKAHRIQQALEDANVNIELMATWPHRKLAERLELVNIQSVLAETKNDAEALDLLEVWRKQLIEARIHKYENNIPDAPNEIQQAIAEIETVTSQIEEREEILSHEIEPEPQKFSKKSTNEAVKDTQLPLF